MLEHLGWLKQLFPVAKWIRDFYKGPRLTIEPRLRARTPNTVHSYVPSVHVTISNSQGETQVVEGRIWLSRSDDPAYKQEEHLPETEMLKGKNQEFSLFVKLEAYDRIVMGEATLKLHYDFRLKRSLRQPYHQSGSYSYNARKRIFERDTHS